MATEAQQATHLAKPAKPKPPKVIETRWARDIVVGDQLALPKGGTVRVLAVQFNHQSSCSGVHIVTSHPSMDGCYNKYVGKLDVRIFDAIFTASEARTFNMGMNVYRDKTL